MTPSLCICELLVARKLLDPKQLLSALDHQERWGGDLADVVSELGFVAPEVVMTELARQLGVPCVDVSGVHVPGAVLRLVPERTMRSRQVLPLRLAGASRRGSLVIATRTPDDFVLLDEVAFVSGMSVSPVLAGAGALEVAIERHLRRPAPPWRPSWAVGPPPVPGARGCLVAVGASVF